MNKSLLCSGAAPNTGHGPPSANQMDLENNLHFGLGTTVTDRDNFDLISHGAAGGRTTSVPASHFAR